MPAACFILPTMRYLVIAAALWATPAAAQFGEALDPVFECVRERAVRYAPLNASLNDVADAAVAACEPLLDEMRPPKAKVSQPDETLRALALITTRLRAEALATVAETRIKVDR